MGWEVCDLRAEVAALRERGVVFEEFARPADTVVAVAEIEGNYPSKHAT
jgi:hypothetical protein